MSRYFKGEEVTRCNKLQELRWMDEGVAVDGGPIPLGVMDLVCVKETSKADLNILESWVIHFQSKDCPWCVTRWSGQKNVGRYQSIGTWLTLWVEMRANPVNH